MSGEVKIYRIDVTLAVKNLTFPKDFMQQLVRELKRAKEQGKIEGASWTIREEIPPPTPKTGTI